MPPQRKPRKKTPKLMRKTFLVDPAKLARARSVLQLKSDTEVLRVALDHLLSHFSNDANEEE
jgi:hypothetical protein